MKTPLLLVVAAFGMAVALPSSARSVAASDDWSWRVGLNLWLPGVDINTRPVPPGGGSINAEADPGGYLKNLQFTFMGTLEARRGPYSFLADMVYLDFGDQESKVRSITGPGGIVTIPVDTGSNTDLKGFVGTFSGGYAFMQDTHARADVFAGLRYAKLKTRLNWEFSGPAGGLDRSGSVESKKDFTDGVVGVRGKVDIGGNWDFRYYLDAGAGTSQFTWQGVAGVGYRYGWGDVVLSYRHLEYKLENDGPVSDMKFSGPQLVVGFTF